MASQIKINVNLLMHAGASHATWPPGAGGQHLNFRKAVTSETMLHACAIWVVLQREDHTVGSCRPSGLTCSATLVVDTAKIPRKI